MSDYIDIESERRAYGIPAEPEAILRRSPRSAVTVLWFAAAVGIASDALFREGPVGIAVPLWVALVALSLTAARWREERNLSGEAGAWLVTAVAFAAGAAWRRSNSEFLRFLNTVASVSALTFAAISLREPTAGAFSERLRDTLRSAKEVVFSALTAFPRLVGREEWLSATTGISRGEPARRLGRSFLIAGVLTLVFGTLLGNADPLFASFVALPHLDVGEIVSHIILFGFFTWIVSGWLQGALIDTEPRASVRIPWAASRADVVTALGTLIALFGAYVVAQLGWFFGGEEFLHARTGLTAAQYARQGFFEMTWIVLLVVPVLLVTRAMLAPRAELARLHTKLALPVVGLLGCIIASAVMRMQLYVSYFGYTVDRVTTLVFMGWLGLVLLWLSVTVLRGDGRRFVPGVIVSALTVLAAINVISPDRFVAAANIARAQENSTVALDREHMAHLSGDAMDLAIDAVVSPRRFAIGTVEGLDESKSQCLATTFLLRRWGAQSDRYDERDTGSWRTWNSGDARANTLVTGRAREIRHTAREACGRVLATLSGNDRRRYYPR